MVNILEMLTEIGKFEDIVIPWDFKSDFAFLRHINHLYVYDFASKKIKENSKVLDVGCGEGYGAAALALVDKNLNVIGIDIDQNRIFHARNKYKFDNIEYKIYNGKKLPFKDSTFDVVTSFQVIEHVKNEYKFISEIYRVLKPGGILIITTVNRIHRLRHGQKPNNIEHVREYYPEDLYQLLKSVFKDVELLGIIGKDKIQQWIVNSNNKGKFGIKKWIYSVYRHKFGFFLPKSLISAFKRFKNKKVEETNNKESNSKLISIDYQKYSLHDFQIIKNNLLYSIDILCICKK